MFDMRGCRINYSGKDYSCQVVCDILYDETAHEIGRWNRDNGDKAIVRKKDRHTSEWEVLEYYPFRRKQ